MSHVWREFLLIGQVYDPSPVHTNVLEMWGALTIYCRLILESAAGYVGIHNQTIMTL